MLVTKGEGRILPTKDGRYFIYLPKKFVEDPSFPFPISESATKILISFKPGVKKLILEKI